MAITADQVPSRRWLARLFLRLVVAIASSIAILATAVILGALPVPAGPVPKEKTVQIAVISNGFHSDIVFPADGTTLDALGVSTSDFPVDPEVVEWWAIGWGSRTAYTSLRAVTDLTPSIIARSIAFDDTVMHIAPLPALDPALGPADGVWFIDISIEQRERLLGRIEKSFTADRSALQDITQGFGDRFYKGAGRFTAWFGCNAWVGRHLRDAGIPVGLWTPTAQALGYGLDRLGASQE